MSEAHCGILVRNLCKSRPRINTDNNLNLLEKFIGDLVFFFLKLVKKSLKLEANVTFNATINQVQGSPNRSMFTMQIPGRIASL